MNDLLDNFQSVSLSTTNRLARMLNRVDKKYVLDRDQYNAFMGIVGNQYGVLEIDNRKIFQYSSCYYDDRYRCYFEHHQARRKRVKVRTREYLNSGLIFFEVKFKGLRGRTDKHRSACQNLLMPSLTGEHLSMLNELYVQKYRMEMPFRLRPALLVNYSRCTLVALRGGERVTIDFDLCFQLPNKPGRPIHIDRNFIIVETKSETGQSVANVALKRIGVRKASKCSKYCVGVNLTGAVDKNNNFLHTIKHIRKNVISDAEKTMIASA